MLGHTTGYLGEKVIHLEFARRLKSFCAAMVHGVNPQEVQNFLILRLNAGAQITRGGQVQGPRQSGTWSISNGKVLRINSQPTDDLEPF